MKKNPLSLLLLAGLLASGSLHAQNLARVNGVAIPSAKAEALVKELAAKGTPDSPQLRDAVKNRLITFELMTQEAMKLDLAKQPDVAVLLETARQDVLVRAFVQDYVKKNPVTDAEIKAEYDKAKARYDAAPKEGAPKEYHARHILMKTEAEAKAVIAKLKAGAKFEDLAKKSEDTSNKDSGGDLGWASPDTFDADFTQGMASLKKGQTSPTPVKTKFGFHVIRLDDVRNVGFPLVEQVKGEIVQGLQRQHVDNMISDLRSKAKIE